MNIVADENVERLVVMKLRKLGYKVRDSRETGKRLPDWKISELAKNGETILTHDRDFLKVEKEGYLVEVRGKMVVKLKGRIVSVAREEVLEGEK